MRYAQKFQLFRESLIAFCKTRISENWRQMLDMWLSCEADMVFGYGYQNKFKEHFGEDIPEALNSNLWLAGKNLLYATISFSSITKNNSNNLNNILYKHFKERERVYTKRDYPYKIIKVNL